MSKLYCGLAGMICIVMSIIAYKVNFPYYGWILAVGFLSVVSSLQD